MTVSFNFTVEISMGKTTNPQETNTKLRDLLVMYSDDYQMDTTILPQVEGESGRIVRAVVDCDTETADYLSSTIRRFGGIQDVTVRKCEPSRDSD